MIFVNKENALLIPSPGVMFLFNSSIQLIITNIDMIFFTVSAGPPKGRDQDMM